MRIFQDNRVTFLLVFLFFISIITVKDPELHNLITHVIFLAIVVYNLFYKSIFFKDFLFNKRRVFIPSIYDTRSKVIDIVFLFLLVALIWINVRELPEEIEKSGLNIFYVLGMVLIFFAWALLKNPVTEIVFGNRWIRIKQYDRTVKKLKKIDKIIIDNKQLSLEYGEYVFEFSKLRLESKIESLIERIKQNDTDIEIVNKTYNL